MKWMPLMGLAALAACNGTTPPPEGTTPPAVAEGCKSEQLNRFVNQKVSDELGAEMLKVSGAKTIRWVAPGMAVTMDFRPDRLTVSYDANKVITQASCG